MMICGENTVERSTKYCHKSIDVFWFPFLGFSFCWVEMTISSKHGLLEKSRFVNWLGSCTWDFPASQVQLPNGSKRYPVSFDMQWSQTSRNQNKRFPNLWTKNITKMQHTPNLCAQHVQSAFPPGPFTRSLHPSTQRPQGETPPRVHPPSAVLVRSRWPGCCSWWHRPWRARTLSIQGMVNCSWIILENCTWYTTWIVTGWKKHRNSMCQVVSGAHPKMNWPGSWLLISGDHKWSKLKGHVWLVRVHSWQYRD